MALNENDLENTEWHVFTPERPKYYFITQDQTLKAEYERGWKIIEAMLVNSVSIVTARDALTIHFDRDSLWRTVQRFAQLPPEEARSQYDLPPDSKDWTIPLAQQDLIHSGPKKENISPITYRPFTRYTYFTGKPSGFHCRPRGNVMKNMLQSNIAISVTRSMEISGDFQHVFASSFLTTHHTTSLKEVNYHFPLWIYPTPPIDLLDEPAPERRPNLSDDFVTALTAAQSRAISPEDTLAYLYAVLYTPDYRTRYADFLRRDFPRVPLSSDKKLFKQLVALGHELIGLHTLQVVPPRITGFPVAGTGEVVKVRYTIAAGQDKGRVWINDAQYFDAVPQAVWDMHIGGYRVAEKWLKDRKGRLLTYDDITHYQSAVAALARTLAIQTKLDTAVAAAGGWPLH